MQYNINPGLCTLMRNQYSCDGAEQVTVDEFHQRIVNGDYRQLVEEIRKLDAQGKEKECAGIKKKLPYFLVQGLCSGARKLGHLNGLTGYAPFDFDHISPQKSTEIITQLRTLCWVKQAHRSCRGGVHSIVAMGIIPYDQLDPRYVQEYKRRYDLIAAELSSLLGEPVDGQCKDAVRGLYVSYDPDAWLRPDAEVQPFDYPDEPTAPFLQEATPIDLPVAAHPEVSLIERYARQFLSRHTYKPSHRHQYWVDWGAYLRWLGVSSEYLGDYQQLMANVLLAEGLVLLDDPLRRDTKEVADAMDWGYQHSHENSQAESEAKLSEDEMIRALPCFPDEVYGLLPDLLHRCVDWLGEPADEGAHRQRDALLMASLTQLSTLAGDTRVPYGDHSHSPNLPFLLLSPSGNGKSAISNAFRLVKPADEYKIQQSMAQIEAFHRQEEIWDREQRDAQQKKRPVDESKRPSGTEPRFQLISMSSTTSKNQLVQMIAAAADDSIILNSTELATVIAALGMDVGNYSDLLCKVTMNEPVDQYYKVDKVPIRANFPRVSLCLSGTINHFHKFIPTLDDGLFSRFLIMLVAPRTEWVSQRPRANGFDPELHFDQLGEEAKEMWNYLRLSPTKVLFTDEQWNLHDAYWAGHLGDVLNEGGQDRMSICTRQGQFHMRLAALLTVIRKWETMKQSGLDRDKSAEVDYQQSTRVMLCSDEDFQTAYLIVSTLLKHSILLSTTKPDIPSAGAQTMQAWEWSGKALDKMGANFTTNEFLAVAKDYGRSSSQAYRTLERLSQQKKIQKVDKKKRMWAKIA